MSEPDGWHGLGGSQVSGADLEALSARRLF